MREQTEEGRDLNQMSASNTVQGFRFPADSQVKWQVLMEEASAHGGEVWIDLQDNWAGMCETIYRCAVTWTDQMWDRVSDMDAPSQVHGPVPDRRPVFELRSPIPALALYGGVGTGVPEFAVVIGVHNGREGKDAHGVVSGSSCIE